MSRFSGFEPLTSRSTSQPLITEGDRAIATDPRPVPAVMIGRPTLG
jgi:hypothetical protein